MTADLSLFPVTAVITDNGHLAIDGRDLADIASQFGTPFYIYDGATLRSQASRLRSLLDTNYPGASLISYASKTYFARAFAEKLAGFGVGTDVVSLGELLVARGAGFQPGVIHLHGNNKSAAELTTALDWDIQAIVVDSLDELALLETLAAERGKPARIWLRITPDLEVATHPHIQTAGPGSKFGLHLQNGQADQAVRQALASRWLRLTGLHMHLGSQLFDAAPYREAIQRIFAVAARNEFFPAEFSPGGGWGVRYTDADPSDDAAPWVQAIAETVQDECNSRGWPCPHLVLESGRWLAARAGVAVYTVGSQKITPDGTHIAAVDGGMADNPRAALYGARYSACVVQRADSPASQTIQIAGKYCESGDVLIPEIRLQPMERGDQLAIPAAGAYHLSMSSNYNFAPRPAVLWLENGAIEVLQPREQPHERGWLVD